MAEQRLRRPSQKQHLLEEVMRRVRLFADRLALAGLTISRTALLLTKCDRANLEKKPDDKSFQDVPQSWYRYRLMSAMAGTDLAGTTMWREEICTSPFHFKQFWCRREIDAQRNYLLCP